MLGHSLALLAVLATLSSTAHGSNLSADSAVASCEIDPWGQCGGKGGECHCGKPGYKCEDKPYSSCSCVDGYTCQKRVRRE